MRDAKSEILTFWFDDTQPQQWFQRSDQFDDLITSRFLDIYRMATDGMFDEWINDAKGCLALCILLDQFPRNMFRGSAESFAMDERARKITDHAIDKGFDQMLSASQRHFLYMPYMHSEEISDQEKSVSLFKALQEDNPIAYKYALSHYEDIKRFGRFPYRNEVLDRKNTPEEDAYLAEI